MKKTFTNESGLILTITDKETGGYIPIMGGDSSNPSWEEYLGEFKEDYRPHLLLIRHALEQLGWVGDTAEKRCNDTLFSFSDGTKIGFSWRAWGDLMQAIVNKREGYMTYYM